MTSTLLHPGHKPDMENPRLKELSYMETIAKLSIANSELQRQVSTIQLEKIHHERQQILKETRD